ncbi:hypothetical protein [Sphingobium nicotianae]|uniref:Uncharacterized protein n=1 Tax=Sphingobium nicotianae TaxID=2782607 RepID=A0A9X1DF79_9SPHN|nr:hypothetical protein [Sphingobium nicotianae]MBT2188870.1 hypothetical protein [Sphingobium nicotianae]
MTDLNILHYGAGALIITSWIGIIAFVGLKGWNGWLALKRAELELVAGHRGASAAAGEGAGTVSAATRIDVADLKERIRKLEAIAAGIDV